MDKKQLELYGIYAERMQECKKIMQDEIDRIVDALTDDPEHKPAEHILSRIKGADSLLEKLERMGFEQTVESGLTNLSDLIGCRIVTHFVGDIYAILDEMKKSEV